jgi:hypothetical protein
MNSMTLRRMNPLQRWRWRMVLPYVQGRRFVFACGHNHAAAMGGGMDGVDGIPLGEMRAPLSQAGVTPVCEIPLQLVLNRSYVARKP